MSKRQSTEITSWVANPESPSDMELHRTLAAKCSKIASIFETGSAQDITRFLDEMPADDDTFEAVSRFCGGNDINMSAENVVPISCLAHHLGMTEFHSPNNLLRRALFFFQHQVLPSWNETLKAFRTSETVLHQAVQIGLVGACVESLVQKALSDPALLGEPEKKAYTNNFDESVADEDELGFRVPNPKNPKRRLFFLNWKSEDLTTLPLRLYEPLMREMIERGVPSGHVAASLCGYARKWAFSGFSGSESASVYARNSRREVIEAVERLLPDERGLVSCGLLFEILSCADLLEASSGCRDGLEFRIGRELHRATAKDLLALSQGRDIECVRRLLKHFYGNYTSTDIIALVKVAELVEEFLAEMAADMDFTKEAFVAMAEISTDVSRGTQRSSDGIYKGVDVYLDKHKHLTESEREEVCRVLDLSGLSAEACDHAAKNERLPVRVVLQVLFLSQLKIRGSIAREAQGSQDGRVFEEEEKEEEEEEEEEARLLEGEEGGAAETEMEKMSRKLVELERECGAMKREIERSENRGPYCRSVVKKEKVSLWKEMKRKFGCISESVSNCNNNCQVKRRKKRIMKSK